MAIPRFLKRGWGLVGAASTLAWLASLGIGGALSSFLANSLDLRQPWFSFCVVSLFLLITAVAVPLMQGAFVWLSGALPRPQISPARQRELQSARERQQRAEEQAQRTRSAIQLVRDELARNRLALFDARQDGHYLNAFRLLGTDVWNSQRPVLAGDPTVARAFRSTAGAYHEVERMIDLIDRRGGGNFVVLGNDRIDRAIDEMVIALSDLREAAEDGAAA
jgi:hypothetical protein